MRRGHVMRRVVPYVPALAWAAAIAVAAGASQVPRTPAIPHFDKVLHFGAYLVLGALLGAGWTRAGRRPGRGWLLLFALLLGVSDEVRQARMQARSGELTDWAADAAGAATGLIMASRLLRRRLDEPRG